MEILRNFGIQPILLLAQIVNFLIILFLLKKFFYKPIIRALEDRKKKIEEGLQNAQTIEENLAKTAEKTAKILEEARAGAQNIMSQARDEAQRISDLQVAEARKLAEEAQSAAKLRAEAQKQAMQRELKQEILALVIEVVQKVLTRTLTSRERRALTSKSISEIASLPASQRGEPAGQEGQVL